MASTVRLSSVCLSSVMFVRLTQQVELFGNTSAAYNSIGTWAVCTKILGKNQWRNQEFDLGVYVLTSHCNFKICVNVPHVNKTVTDFGVYIPIYLPSLRPWKKSRDSI